MQTIPIVSSFVFHKDKFLLLKRSNEVSTYRERWGIVAGKIEKDHSLLENAYREIYEETKITHEKLELIKKGRSCVLPDKVYGILWIINPFRFNLKEKVEIRIDREHTEYNWIKPEELKNYDYVINLNETLARILQDEEQNRDICT